MVDQNVPSDEELILKTQQGIWDAFTDLYDRYLPVVYNRVRYRVPEADVEDVTQEVFITVTKSLKGFKGNAKFSTWLRTVTDRRVADYYRARSQAEVQLDTPLSEVAPGRIKALSVNRTKATDESVLLREAIKSLPFHYQNVVLLRFAEGLKFSDIARTTGQSLEATKSLFRRAMAALREELGEIDA